MARMSKSNCRGELAIVAENFHLPSRCRGQNLQSPNKKGEYNYCFSNRKKNKFDKELIKDIFKELMVIIINNNFRN